MDNYLCLEFLKTVYYCISGYRNAKIQKALLISFSLNVILHRKAAGEIFKSGSFCELGHELVSLKLVLLYNKANFNEAVFNESQLSMKVN